MTKSSCTAWHGAPSANDQEQRITVLANAGYSNGQLLKRCQAHGLIPYVPVNRAINNQGDGKLFDKSAFTYHAEGDYYQCPAGQRLAKKTKSTAKRLYLYTNAACQDCHVRQRCTTAEQRWVTRHFEEEDVLDAVADRSAANPLMMQRRKGMVEHPLGTLKRQMDGGRFLLRGLQKVKA
jgi:transposase